MIKVLDNIGSPLQMTWTHWHRVTEIDCNLSTIICIYVLEDRCLQTSNSLRVIVVSLRGIVWRQVASHQLKVVATTILNQSLMGKSDCHAIFFSVCDCVIR